MVEDSLVHNCGEGFRLDEGVIETKYTYGVALLNLPGYLIATAAGGEIDKTISPEYHYAVLFTALIVLFLGLYYLERTLMYYVDRRVLYLLVPLLLFGTNLFYYTVDKAGFSHVYLFSLLTIAWYGIERFYRQGVRKYWLLFMICFSMAVVMRPTSVLSLPVFIALNPSVDGWRAKFTFWFRRWRLLIGSMIIPLLILVPQIIYWKYAYGDWLSYSYGDEGFTHWDDPYLLSVLFNPLNGWILYTPMATLMLIGMPLLVLKRKFIGVGLVVTFLLAWYAFSSWWSWYFGCAFGGRSFVDYYGFLALPMFFVVERLFLKKWLWVKALVGACFFVLIYVNIQMTYTYDDCFYGNSWEWESYFDELSKL